MVGIRVAEPIVPIYLDKAGMRKLKKMEGQGKLLFVYLLFNAMFL